MPKPAFLSREQARKVLDHHVFTPDARGGVPKNVNPADLPLYLEEVLVEKFGEPYSWRLFQVMDHYDTQQELELLRPFMNRAERDDDQFGRSVCYSVIGASMGTNGQKAEALEYYEYLLAHRLASGHLDRLIECYAVLLVDLTPTSPAERIRKEGAGLQRRANVDPNAEFGVNEMDELLNLVLPECEEDVRNIKQLRQIRDRPQQYRALAECYVGLQRDLGTVGQLWVQRTLRREGRATPAPVVKAFREMLADNRFRGVDEEHTRLMRIRALRAVDFVGGEVDKKEARLIEKQDPGDTDALCWF
ncbi:MAG: hypothetical protein HY763_02295 [Planctomycetes bacterium]|nr:hypothetical protein [Planctomycetota bacterium]